MLGDAALEQYRIVASLDRSDLDESGNSARVGGLPMRSWTGCLGSGRCLKSLGLTQLMVRKLKEPRSVLLTSGQAVQLGRATRSDTCDAGSTASRGLCAYCTLSRKTWEAEFPGFELMANFKVFSLAKRFTDAAPTVAPMLEGFGQGHRRAFSNAEDGVRRLPSSGGESWPRRRASVTSLPGRDPWR